jgi:uncharacterized membrane protein YphA (DoxX/SURF4 family)
VSAFFVSAATYGIAVDEKFILTPELATPYYWISLLQLLIAMLALSSVSSHLAGIGMIGLYAYSIFEYGVYHLLDYPIFVGVALYLIIDSLHGRQRIDSALTIARVGTGITLLWASIEKFAFPEWSFALLDGSPELAFGLNSEFYMIAAGFVEFCAAFLLITGMLSARVSALVLLFFFVSAIFFFGVLDAIGHSVIIILLVLLSLSRNPLAERMAVRGPSSTAVVHTVLFFLALLFFIGIYCGGHYLSYQPYSECLVNGAGTKILSID